MNSFELRMFGNRQRSEMVPRSVRFFGLEVKDVEYRGFSIGVRSQDFGFGLSVFRGSRKSQTGYIIVARLLHVHKLVRNIMTSYADGPMVRQIFSAGFTSLAGEALQQPVGGRREGASR